MIEGHDPQQAQAHARSVLGTKQFAVATNTGKHSSLDEMLALGVTARAFKSGSYLPEGAPQEGTTEPAASNVTCWHQTAYVSLNESLTAALTVSNLGCCGVIHPSGERARLGGELVAEFRALTPARDPVAEHTGASDGSS
jgi:hypothetical protein